MYSVIMMTVMSTQPALPGGLFGDREGGILRGRRSGAGGCQGVQVVQSCAPAYAVQQPVYAVQPVYAAPIVAAGCNGYAAGAGCYGGGYGVPVYAAACYGGNGGERQGILARLRERRNRSNVGNGCLGYVAAAPACCNNAAQLPVQVVPPYPTQLPDPNRPILPPTQLPATPKDYRPGPGGNGTVAPQSFGMERNAIARR